MEEWMFPDKSNANESLILYKLIVLYMLEAIQMPLSNSQLCEFFLSQNLASYFTVQQTIGELLERSLIQEKKELHTTHYTITKNGMDTLNCYRKLISADVCALMQDYLKENNLSILQSLSVNASYEPTKQKDFLVHCAIKEGGRSIFDLELNAPNEAIAEKMCDNWKKKHEILYANLMKELL